MTPVSPLPTNRIDALFAIWDRADSPGCALGIVRDGALAYARGYGMANLEYGLPIAPSSVFHVASISKHFTATAIVLLAREGRLALDDDIRHHLPELPDFGAPITLRHLLNHTGGLRDQWELLALAGWRPDDLKTNDDVLDLATRQRDLNFPPGAEWLYSNTGYTLAAIVVERVSGQTLRAFLAERVFGPLGMARTHFHDDHSEIVPGRAFAYVPRPEGGYRISIPVFDTVGATSLFTTVEDLARWIAHLGPLRGDPTSLLSELTVPGVLNDGSRTDYGLGLRVSTLLGTPLIEHSGADAGYRAHLLWLPEAGLAVAVLANVGTFLPNLLAVRVAALCLGQEPTPESAEGAADPAALAQLAGIYRQRGIGRLLRAHVAHGALHLGETPLAPLADGTFRWGATICRFAAGADGPRGLHERGMVGGQETHYDWLAPATPDEEMLADYVGDYHCPELDVTFTITRRAGELIVRRRKFLDRTLHPTLADGFTDDRHQLDFARDSAGSVTGFALTTGRVRRLRFVRAAPDAAD